MMQLSFRKSVVLILLVFRGSICEGQNTPCPLCKDGSVVLNPDTIVQIPAGYVDIDQATCKQIQIVSASGALDESMCSILSSGVFKTDCLCSEPVASVAPTIPPFAFPTNSPTQNPISFPTIVPIYVYQVPAPVAVSADSISPKAPTPVAYQTLAPKVGVYQSSTSQIPAPTIKYQTLAPRSYTYRGPTAEPESSTEQGSTSLKPVVYQTLAPRSNSYQATSVANKTNAPVAQIQQYPIRYQTLAPRSNVSRTPVSSPRTSAPMQTNLPYSAPVVVPAPIPLPISVFTRRPTPIIEFDYKVCSICGANQRVANRTKIVVSPPGYFIQKASCYQLERVGLIGLMNSINCRLATLLIGEPKCGCIAKEKSPKEPPSVPVNATVCHVCGKGYVVGKPSNTIQRKLGFFVGSASCGQVAEIGLIGLIPPGLCSVTKQDVKSNCGCVRVTNTPTGLASDYPSAVPSYKPSPSPTSEKERGKEAEDGEPKHDDNDEPKHDDDDKQKYEDVPTDEQEPKKNRWPYFFNDLV